MVKNHTFSLRNLSALQLKFSLAIDKEYAVGGCTGRVILYFGVAEPLLEFLQRDDLAVALLLFFSGLFTPRIELLVGDAPGFDLRKALFVLLAVRLENRVVGLFFRPLPERADLAAALLTVLYRALAVLRAHAPSLRKPAAAILAAAHGHAALDAASQRIVDHVPRTEDEYKTGAQRPGSTGSKLSGIGSNRNSSGSLGWS